MLPFLVFYTKLLCVYLHVDFKAGIVLGLYKKTKETKEKKTMPRMTSVQVLRALGMHPKYKGYAYLMFVLNQTFEKPGTVYELTSKLYPDLMQQYSVSRASVERNISFAIKRTFEDGNQTLLKKLFDSYSSNYIPTNAEFIAVLTQIACHCSAEIITSSVKHSVQETLEYFTA